jgi:hypothetical protein
LRLGLNGFPTLIEYDGDSSENVDIYPLLGVILTG